MTRFLQLLSCPIVWPLSVIEKLLKTKFQWLVSDLELLFWQTGLPILKICLGLCQGQT